MIAALSVAPPDVFEAVLGQACAALEKKLGTQLQSLDGHEFERLAVCAMQSEAIGTPFAGKIMPTKDKEFPDVFAEGDRYGVEVKKTKQKNFKTLGNSIFGGTSIEGIDRIYLLMANRKEVMWEHYSKVLSGIAVTHSPRFFINGKAKKGETVFDEMGVCYDEFREMEQPEKMELLRNKLYDGKTELWWLLTKNQSPAYQFYRDLSPKRKAKLVVKAMVFCPQIFGKRQDKFNKVLPLFMGEGVILHNLRDLFTGGGKWEYKGQQYPRIYEKVLTHRVCINAMLRISKYDELKDFWKNLQAFQSIREEWIKRVNSENSQYDVRHLLS